MNNFHYPQFLLETLYGIEISESKYEEIALIAWNLIGNKRCRTYRYIADIDPDTLSVTLPCNAFGEGGFLEAVTYGFEDWNYVTNSSVNGDVNSAHVENYIEGRKLFSDPLYISGKYARYEQSGRTLYFDKNYGKVNILYRGIEVDDDGLPEITDSEALAIAVYVAYVTKFKQGMTNNDQNALAISQVLQQEWKQKCDAARVPEHISQNDMQEILNASARWDRKIFNKSYKPYI